MARPALIIAALASVLSSGFSWQSAACTTHRPYLLTTVVDQRAWADAVGHVQPNFEASEGEHFYMLEVSEQQAQYIQEAFDGGCTPQVEFDTRGTTSTLGAGDAWYLGMAEAHVNAAVIGSRVTESESHPMKDCTTLVCQKTNQHYQSLTSPVAAGSLIIVDGKARAYARAGGTSTSDQAHADWRIQYPVLLIPIP